MSKIFVSKCMIVIQLVWASTNLFLFCKIKAIYFPTAIIIHTEPKEIKRETRLAVIGIASYGSS